MPQDYNQTLNLPKTDFQMRAGLPQKEPVMIEKWESDGLYKKLIAKNEGKPTYILHDGPPYANGDIHLGTALNKVLKDIIVKYKNMAGFCSNYVPGWDTHGLPIELKAMKKAGIGNGITSLSPVELRKICREFALSYVEDQKNQFKRLGVWGDFDDPYLTLKPEFEARQIEIFGEMAKKGYIYKGHKPVYWCPHCVTALAEAEIEYAEDPCHSIYVKFKVKNDKNSVLANMGADLENTYFVIWTTTTWTLWLSVLALTMITALSRQTANTTLWLVTSLMPLWLLQKSKITNLSATLRVLTLNTFLVTILSLTAILWLSLETT